MSSRNHDRDTIVHSVIEMPFAGSLPKRVERIYLSVCGSQVLKAVFISRLSLPIYLAALTLGSVILKGRHH
jgi:hypothetical protein